MTTRSILQVFDDYQKARIAFVQHIAELALRPQNIEILIEANVLELLRPLLSDVCFQIQQCAALAIGRLVHHDAKLAGQVLNRDFLPVLLRDIDKQNKYFKKASLFALRAICKHDPEMAAIVANSGGLEALILCLEDFEMIVKEGAAWAVGYIAKHNLFLAQKVVDAGAVPLLILCLQEPELSLKQIAALVLSDIGKHSLDLAQCLVDGGAVPHLVKCLNNQDEKLKRHVLSALSSIAKHSSELSEVVVEAEVFPNVLFHMAHACPLVRKNATILVRDIVKHSLELTQLVVNIGGIGALLEILNQNNNECRIPCITALGYIAGHSDQLALSILGCKGILQLANMLETSEDDATLAVTAWAIGQIGKHSPEHSRAVAVANIFPKLLELYMDPNSSEDLKYKSKLTLKQCLQKCLVLSALEPILHTAPPNILKYVMAQFSKVLPCDPKARRLFVTSGGLKKVQEINAEPGSTLMEYIATVNACFPEEIVRYYSPGYSESLLDRVEQYNPQMTSILRESSLKADETQTPINLILDQTTSPTGSQELQQYFSTGQA